MCQRLNTGESNNFYFGIFICIGPLTLRIMNRIVPPESAMHWCIGESFRLYCSLISTICCVNHVNFPEGHVKWIFSSPAYAVKEILKVVIV